MTANGSRTKANWRNWVIPVVLGVAWHVFWWSWLSPATAKGRAYVPSGPYVRYMPAAATDGQLQGDVRAVWSPVLFSLPTAVGFSMPAMKSAGDMRPPLWASHKSSVFLERRVSEGPKLGVVEREPLEAQVARVLDEVSLDASESLSFKAAVKRKGVTVDFRDGLKEGDFRTATLPDEPIFSELAWEARVHIDMGADGGVRHVFLEVPTESARRNHALITQLRQWRLAEAGEPRSGKVILRNTRPAGKDAR